MTNYLWITSRFKLKKSLNDYNIIHYYGTKEQFKTYLLINGHWNGLTEMVKRAKKFKLIKKKTLTKK